MSHAVRVDPERHEIDLLLEMAPELRGARVLEVGCGDGRLTKLYAHLASGVLAIDPSERRIEAARSASVAQSVRFRRAGIEDVRRSAVAFDVGILAWSL